jgi:hypothetical protein
LAMPRRASLKANACGASRRIAAASSANSSGVGRGLSAAPQARKTTTPDSRPASVSVA